MTTPTWWQIASYKDYCEAIGQEALMIDRSYLDDTFTITCDESGCVCEEIYNTGGDWDAMIAQAKADGWVMQQTEGEWKHSCPAHRL